MGVDSLSDKGKVKGMSDFKKDLILGHQTPVTAPEDPETAPVTGYGDYLDAVKEQEEEFFRLQEAFFAISLDDERILRAAKRWEECGVILAGYAGTLFNKDQYNNAQREYARKLFDLVTKASAIRRNNIAKYRRLMMKKQDLSEKEEDKLTKAKYDADRALIRAVNTQARYRDLFEKGEILNNSQLRKDIECSIIAKRERDRMPEGTIHMPGKIYPPIPIPRGERVPEWPEPYQMMKSLPPEVKVYDPELDELVLPPGYVSPDGLIDDQSVIRDREHGEVIIKFRGGEPVVWKEWKARGTWDVPDPNSWFAEYFLRLMDQIEEDKRVGILEPWPYERETEEYNRIPDGGKT